MPSWIAVTKWSKYQKKLLAEAIGLGGIYKVHRYNEKMPAYIVRPSDIKKNLKRVPIRRWDVLRRKGAFYTPEIQGHYYLFFIRDEIKNNPTFFDPDVPSRCYFIINKMNEGWRLEGRLKYKDVPTTYRLYRGEEWLGVQHKVAWKTEELGCIRPIGPMHNGVIHYELTEKYIRA